MTSARAAAAQAFADLDAIDRRCNDRPINPRDAGLKDAALRRLAGAMDAEFGALPDERHVPLRATKWTPPVDDLADRDDDIGDELADREDWTTWQR